MFFYLYFTKKNHADFLVLFREIIAATFLLFTVASNSPKRYFFLDNLTLRALISSETSEALILMTHCNILEDSKPQNYVWIRKTN